MNQENNLHELINSRETLEVAVAEVARLKIEHAHAISELEMEISAAQKSSQPKLFGLAQQIELREAGIFAYCQQNKDSLFATKKSVDLLLATIGFRTTPPRVDKLNRKDKWSRIALRLGSLEWGRNYLHHCTPEVNKDRLLADRTKLTPEQLAQAGIAFAQDENFYLEPHSELAKPTKVREAA